MKYTLLLFFLLISCNKDTSDLVFIKADLPSTPTSDTEALANAWTEEFVTLVNNHRHGLGLRSLTHSETLDEIASTHSMSMALGSRKFGHDGFQERCQEGHSLLGGGTWCAENVAMGSKSPLNVFNTWINSPSHKAHIESERATHTGLGIAIDVNGRFYWTQLLLEL